SSPVSLADLREGVENFLAGLEEDRYQADVRRHEGAHPWRRYARETHRFSRGRVAEIQRALAEASGDEERRLRDLLAFIALGQGYREAAMLMEERFEWEASGVVTGPEFEYAPREVPQALAATSEPDRRRAIESAFQRARQERRIVAEESVARFRGAVGEL